MESEAGRVERMEIEVYPEMAEKQLEGIFIDVENTSSDAALSRVLDDLNYRAIMIGFPLLTLGIVTGAAWANYAWGTYWSWDPKETWSLIVWFIYAAFLHARITRGWVGRRAAILSVVGFAATIFCYLGVNLFLSGLHSYGK